MHERPCVPSKVESVDDSAAPFSKPISLCRYQDLAEAENRLREQQAQERNSREERSSQITSVSQQLGASEVDTDNSRGRFLNRTIEKEIQWYDCEGIDGSSITVVECQYFLEQDQDGSLRTYPGARRFALANGSAVRRIDGKTFELVDTGELIAVRACNI